MLDGGYPSGCFEISIPGKRHCFRLFFAAVLLVSFLLLLHTVGCSSNCALFSVAISCNKIVRARRDLQRNHGRLFQVDERGRIHSTVHWNSSSFDPRFPRECCMFLWDGSLPEVPSFFGLTILQYFRNYYTYFTPTEFVYCHTNAKKKVG